MFFSKRPRVLGLVSIRAAVSSSITDSTASGAITPLDSSIETIEKPASAELAGFVPWAVSGIITFFLGLPLSLKYAAIISMPHNSPWAPAAGCSVTASIPLISPKKPSSSYMSRRAPWLSSSGWYGWTFENPGSLAISSFIFGLYFMVHEPSG